MNYLLKSIPFVAFFLITVSGFSQSTAKVYVDGKEVSAVMPNAETYKLEFPIRMEEGSKALNRPMAKELSYRLNIAGDEDLFSNGTVHWEDVMDNSAKNWKKFAQSGGVITKELDASKIYDELKMLYDNDRLPSSDFQITIKMETIKKSLNMDYFTISEVSLNVPVNELKGKFKAADSENNIQLEKDGIEAFKANWKKKLNDPVLANAIEEHIESVRGVDFITINPQSLVYKANTNNFSWEATVIFKENGECKRNWLHGRGVRVSDSKYNVSSYNAGTMDKPMNCQASEALRNR